MIIQWRGMNRLKGLDLVDSVPEELWLEVHKIVQEVVTKTIPKKYVKLSDIKVITVMTSSLPLERYMWKLDPCIL